MIINSYRNNQKVTDQKLSIAFLPY